METLYRKVAVSERLPEAKKYYITDEGELYLDAYKNWQLSEFSKKAKVSKHHEEYFEEPDFWLEEVPDNEESLRQQNKELVEMLEKVSIHVDWSYDNWTSNDGNIIKDEITELLNKVKQPNHQ